MEQDIYRIAAQQAIEKALKGGEYYHQDSVGLQCEYGSAGNVRFPSPGQVTMCDSEGKVVLCACGQPAGAGILGRESYIAFCGDCYHKHLSEKEATFSYKEPVKKEFESQVLTDAFVINLREMREDGTT